MEIKLMIVDDHRILREGLEFMLKMRDEIKIIATASSGMEAIEVARKTSPELILMDISMPPGMDGIEAAKIIKEENKEAKIVFLSMEMNEKHISSAINLGASGYLPKDISDDKLFDAIKSIYQGETYFDPKISDLIFNRFVKKASSKDSNSITAGDELSKREIEVLKLIAEGMPNREISDKLFISVRTVDAHRNHIMKKLDLRTTADLVKYAIRNELIEL